MPNASLFAARSTRHNSGFADAAADRRSADRRDRPVLTASSLYWRRCSPTQRDSAWTVHAGSANAQLVGITVASPWYVLVNVARQSRLPEITRRTCCADKQPPSW